MAGRGFLKSLLASKLAAEEPPKSVNPTIPEKLPIPEEPPKFDEPSRFEDADVSSTPVPAFVPALIPGSQHVVRGRRALIAHLANRTIENKSMCDGIPSSFPKIGSKNVEDLSTSMAKLKCVSVDTPRPIPESQPQPQPKYMETIQKDAPPVICRVLANPNKESYHMDQLSSNYIQMKVEENKGIYEYRVDFNPPVDAKSARFFLVNQNKEHFPVKTFDGTLLYVPTMLPQDVTVLVGTLRDESEVTLTITFKRKNSLQECIHFYNVFLRTIMKILGLVEFGRSCYDQNKRMLIPEFELEVWPGYITTIDEFENGLYMCCEVSHRVLRVKTVLQIMTDIGVKAKDTDQDAKLEIMACLCGSTVITHYNRKTYRIDDIDFSMSPLSKFDQNGTEISYVDYYKKMYDIDIKNLNQPMLITKAKKKDINKKNADKDMDVCCLVPELCNLTGLTDAMRSDFKLMKALQAHTLITPEMRQKATVDFVKRINDHETASRKFKDWGLKMRPIPVRLEGPSYKRETIILGNNLRKQVGSNMDWGLDVARNAMFVAVNLTNWVILYTQRDEGSAKSFCRQLSICGQPLGMEIHPPKPIKVSGNNPEVFVSAINRVVRAISNLQMVVIIFPNQREDRYNAVKRICCADFGMPSQVIISKTLARPDRLQAITQKIALQINCKLGGACWAIDIPLKNTMIVGIDVYHEKGKQLSSVVGFVASMDKRYTEWYSVAGLQKNTHQEIVHMIQESFHKVINNYKIKNGVLPDKIIIYRDGVSDGDLKHVKEIELYDLEESFKSYPGTYCPMITCVIVQKRINTRVFKYIDGVYANPNPGTVIDNTITRRNFFDFFLVSQNVRQGTVNPTHYIVLKNGCGLSTENVQRLSYKLCHLYYNWCGTVKVPAPVQYAHKLAYLVGQNVRQMPNETMNNSLYYL